MSQFASHQAQALPHVASYSAVDRATNWLFSTLTRPDVIVVLAFCAIGLALTLAAVATSPDFASLLAETGSMP